MSSLWYAPPRQSLKPTFFTGLAGPPGQIPGALLPRPTSGTVVRSKPKLKKRCTLSDALSLSTKSTPTSRCVGEVLALQGSLGQGQKPPSEGIRGRGCNFSEGTRKPSRWGLSQDPKDNTSNSRAPFHASSTSLLKENPQQPQGPRTTESTPLRPSGWPKHAREPRAKTRLEKNVSVMEMPKLVVLSNSPASTSSGATCAAEKPMFPSSGVSAFSPTGGNCSIKPSKEFRHMSGPNLLLRSLLSVGKNWLTNTPAMLSPQAFLKGASMLQLTNPKAMFTPTLNCNCIMMGIARSESMCGKSMSACSPLTTVSMRTRMMPCPFCGRAEPGTTASLPKGMRLASSLNWT
mmetsp:Transcript_113175/g.359712  ORF Transcript_113175/g.359712 Transcript_113175/m.359712 type:complete len:347 (+) Transcript_113175:628-1668(+)